MIDVISGKPGQGKTYWAMVWMAWLVEQFENDPAKKERFPNGIVTDLHLHEPLASHVTEIDGFDQLLEIKDCVLVLDEAQMYMNARAYAALPMGVQSLLQQHRKRNIHIIFITQNARRIDVVARELIARYFEVSRGSFWFLKRLVFLEEFDPEGSLWSEGDQGESDPEAKRAKRLRWRLIWMPGMPDEAVLELPGYLTCLAGEARKTAWSAYNSKQEIKIPRGSRVNASSTMAETSKK